jgi:flagella basal body P-ring formation protein FlgA
MQAKLFTKTVMVHIAMTVFVFMWANLILSQDKPTLAYARDNVMISETTLHNKIIAAVKKNLESDEAEVAEIAPPRLSPIRTSKTAQLEIVVTGDIRGGRIPVELTLKEGERVTRKQRLFVAIDFYTSTWATKVDLESGHILQNADLHEIKVASKKVRRDQITDPKVIIGGILKRKVKANKPLKKSMIRIPRLIKRGSIVELIFRRGGILLSAKGEALGDGKRSDIVKVKNLKSKKIVTGRVIGVNQVDVGR